MTSQTPIVAARRGDTASIAERGRLQSVDLALRALDLLGTGGELGVSDLARRLGVAKSTSHRILSTLAHRGYVEQSAETGTYRLALHVFELGQQVESRTALNRVCLPLLRHLAEQTGHSVHLSMPDRSDMVVVESVRGVREDFATPAQPGGRCPVQHAISGWAAAAHDNRVSTVLARKPEVQRRLADIRHLGYAVGGDWRRPGRINISVPVLGTRSVSATVTLGAAEDRVHGQLQRLTPALLGTSRLISRALQSA